MLEAEAGLGVVTVPLSKCGLSYAHLPPRAGFDVQDTQKVILPWCRCRFAGACWRSAAALLQLIAAGSEAIHYPILPKIVAIDGKTHGVAACVQSEIAPIGKHSCLRGVIWMCRRFSPSSNPRLPQASTIASCHGDRWG